MPAPTEEELSRMAREAVRQPADPRLDKQLAWMGLTDTADPVEPRASQPRGRAAATGSELEDVREQLRRIEAIVWALVVVTGIIALLVVVLLLR